jgi:hypothetical protein
MGLRRIGLDEPRQNTKDRGPTPPLQTLRTPRRLLPALALSALLATSGRARAADVELSRITPVPAGEQIPAVDFVRPPILYNPSLNPSGTHIAALVTAGADRYQLMVDNLGTQKFEMLSGVGDTDIGGYVWLDDNRLVFSVGVQKLYGTGLYAADIDNLANAYSLLQYVGSRLIAVPQADRLHPLASISPDSMNSGNVGRVVELNTEIKTGKIFNLLSPGISDEVIHTMQEDNQAHIVETYPGPQEGLDAGFLTDKDGKLAFAFTAANGVFTMLRLEDGDWKRCPVDLDTVDVLGCGREHNEVVVIGPRQAGRPRALQFMNAATGELGDVIYQDPIYDFNGSLYRDRVTQQILGAYISRNGPRTVWFDPDYRKLQKRLEGTFPGLVVTVIGTNDEGSIAVVETYSDRQPAIYYWVDLAKHAVGLIKNSRPWVDPKQMQPMHAIRYKTRDGRTLDAYLTLPAGASKASPPPLVVIARDDSDIYRSQFERSQGRYTWGYNEQAQFLASRGYGVLQPNTRISAGYWSMFPKQDEWDFRKIANDVTDATNTLVASGLVDRQRIAVMGAGFGAYLALASAESEPQLYRCGLAIEGTYDWASFMGYFSDDKHDNGMYDRMVRFLGNPHRDSEKFKALSVTDSIGKLRMPIFVAYDKIEVFYEQQGKELVSALDSAGIPHEAAQIGSDRFGIGYLENRVDLFQKEEAFLGKNLK